VDLSGALDGVELGVLLLTVAIPLVLVAVAYAVLLVRAAVAARAVPRLEAVVLGFVTNFLDALGIGSFAPTMAWFKFRGLVPDRLIPSTMIAGHTLPSVVLSLIFLVLLGVSVDPVLLAGCIVAAAAGAVFGAGFAARARVWVVQAVVGIALVIAGALYAATNLDLMPGGGVASGLPAGLTVVAVVASAVFGALLNFGIGNFAPTLLMLSLMGMDPRLSFPIMAGGSALAGASVSLRYLAQREMDLRMAGGIALGGIPAVLVAAFIVKSMSLAWLRWLVVVVVAYAAAVMFRAAARGARTSAPPS